MPELLKSAVAAMASILCNGPDGQDWLDALTEAPDRLDYLDHEGWVLVPKQEIQLAVAALDDLDAVDWTHESTFTRLAARVGFIPGRSE